MARTTQRVFGWDLALGLVVSLNGLRSCCYLDRNCDNVLNVSVVPFCGIFMEYQGKKPDTLGYKFNLRFSLRFLGYLILLS